MKVAVIGANGQLGSDLVAALAAAGHEPAPLTHAEIEVAALESVRAALAPLAPQAVLNTAAFHNLPSCEEEPERAFAVNAVGALNVARVAAELGARNLFFSTDYVFDGAKGEPYVEDDPPRPLNVYGVSKVAGERLTLAHDPTALVVRVSGIYGKTPCRAKGANFVTKMIELAGSRPEVRVVTDEVLSPTPTRAIASKAVELLATEASGILHLTCRGSCSWYEFARQIFDTLRLETPLHEATVADFPSPVRRPHYSVLANTRLAALGLEPMPGWREALVEFLETGVAAAATH
jgi:dTDP-4-dehydrorhamnose reductase